MMTRLMVLTVAAAACFGLDVSAAVAQSQTCQKLSNSLNSLERTSDFRQLDDNSSNARDIAQQVQKAESAYVRTGCNAAAKAGQTLTRDCRALARTITTGRKQYSSLSRSVDTGTAVKQQREAILQQMARFNCSKNSRAGVFQQGNGRRNLFEQLFDQLSNGFGEVTGDEFAGYGSYHTVRTVCVRKTDGYYWPISYSTLVDYAPNDATQCQEQCPGMDVDLYYYDNPGQEPEQMINLSGEAYTSLPNAFRYRTEFDKAATCKPEVTYGSIKLVAQDDGQSRAMIEYGSTTFPLPMRDPRRVAVASIAPLDDAQYIDVPLPRRRPAGPGEEAPAVIKPTSSAAPARVVDFHGKRVRIVGPDTPYVPEAATGT